MRIGIDNGISGGLVARSDHDGSYIDGITMASERWRSRNEIDVLAVRKCIRSVCDGEPHKKLLSVTVEEPNNSRTPSTAYSVASSFHSLRALLDLWQLPWRRITPQSWQKVMLLKCAKGDTKPRALHEARNRWPDEAFLASPRCKVSHEGIVDAALIAEYSRRMKL